MSHSNTDAEPVEEINGSDVAGKSQIEISGADFSKLGQELFSATTLEGASQIIATIADELFGWDGFVLNLYSPESDTIYSVFASDTIDGQRRDVTTPSHRERPSTTSRRVLENGAELIFKEGMEPGSRPYGDTARPSATIMRVQLRLRSKPNGIVAVHSYTPRAYTTKDLNILQTLADYCGGAFDRIWAEENLRKLHRQLLETSRHAGMAEVATSVLHNVGNVLNSVNVSASVIADKIRNSRIARLSQVVALIDAHSSDLGQFFTNDVKGRELPAYLRSLATHLVEEQAHVLEEVASLTTAIDHIKDIVAMQQNYARVSGVPEQINVNDLVEDAIRMNAEAMVRHEIHLVRDYLEIIHATVDKHKVLQILVNLIRNAKEALGAAGDADRQIVLRVESGGPDRVKISVIDNGVGIPEENFVKIFSHGFTTRKDGHGFGLHSGALSAREIGGSLTVESAGWGKGATFILEFPRQPAPAPTPSQTPAA